METGGHKPGKEDRICPLCALKLSNPGLPAELWDAFDSGYDSDGPIEDEHHAIFDCPGYTHAREQFQALFRSISPLSANFLTSLSATG